MRGPWQERLNQVKDAPRQLCRCPGLCDCGGVVDDCGSAGQHLSTSEVLVNELKPTRNF
jgi:hypothetical protein